MIGYDNLNPTALMDLQLREGTGTVLADWAKGYRTKPIHSAAWAFLANDLSHLVFDAAGPDNIISLAADSTDLAFTSGAFSGAVWICPDAYGNRYFMQKGAAETGWAFWVTSTSPYLVFTTEQAGPTYQSTLGGANLVLSSWQLIGFTRNGAAGKIYLNGRDVTVTAATHVNPVDSTAGDFYIGTTVGGGAGFYDGLMWRPRIWGRTLAASEMLAIYESQRSLFGV